MATEDNGRDEHGRWLPGRSANPAGRPKTTPDFRATVDAYAASEGVSIEEAMWRVFKAMLDAGAEGDVNAARLVFDRWYGKLTESVHAHTTYDGGMPVVPTGDALTAWMQRLVEVQDEFDGDED